MFEHDGLPKGATARARSLRRRMTWSEQRLWRELRKLDANFRRQAPIGPYFADFASHGRRLVIEVDGGVHQRLPQVAARDVKRQRWLESQGYTVVRFMDNQVGNDVDACIQVVEQHLALLLDGGGLGGGVASDSEARRSSAPTPDGAQAFTATRPPPSPTLPPSRRKGAVGHFPTAANGGDAC